MASLGNPRNWIPYTTIKDCSLGFCSLSCPQWCYTVYPPPPPPSMEFPDEDSSPSFSPIVIAIIGVLASAFLLVSYYTIISKYCGNNTTQSSHQETHDEELQDNHHNPSLHEPWHVQSHTGLDEALIKSITICKYKKRDGLVSVADCSVCLSEFEDDESIRLLPKCSHAFHLPCIDTWLKSHSTCPLCRSSIFTFNASSLLVVSPPVMDIPIPIPSRDNETPLENQPENENERVGLVEEDEAECSSSVRKPAMRAFSDLGNCEGRNRHSVIEIVRDEGCYDNYESIRRSVSMDHSFQSGVSDSDAVAILHMKQVEEEEGCSKSSNHRRRVLHCVLNPAAMKRSFSSGRFSFSLTRNARGGRQGINII